MSEAFANRNNFSSLTDGKNDKYNELLREFPELFEEIEAYVNRKNTSKSKDVEIEDTQGGEKKSTAVRSLLSMKRGELAEATDEDTETNLRIDGLILRNAAYKMIVDKVNDMYGKDWEHHISSFGMKIDDRGRLTFVDVETSGDDPKANARATAIMNAWQGVKIREQRSDETDEEYEQNVPTIKEFAQELGLAMLEHHDDEHGDVKEFKHEIIFGQGFLSGVEILSPAADRAAMAEATLLEREIGTALGSFFRNTMVIENPFDVIFGSNGLLSLGEDGALLSVDSDAINQVLSDMNAYLLTEEEGEETEGLLSGELLGIGEKLVELKEVMGKVHDKSLLPKDGLRFPI